MKRLAATIASIALKQSKNQTVYKPVFLKLSRTRDKAQFKQLLKLPGIKLHDAIEGQIKELIKSRHPQKKFSAADMELAIKSHLGKTPMENYGVWVYYPWSQRLVHVLDRNEFIKVRTSRNQYKITPEEQALLATKKIGVIGLSVGQSVSVTLAMERICGELRLADFDILELTNLNRIRTGVHNLNLSKTISVAREIAEIDPYLKVVCFPEGLSESNLDSFFTKGGKLDLMVEESDGFDIKILSRYKARELKVPVLMEASDRCMVDVERFDLEPKRKILHGLVDHLDVATLKSLKTNEEKIPYMLDILGLETSSLRLKASMLEIEQSINTWPQLASAVTMGGGIAADVSRRILLNTFTDSGRYYVDLEQLIGNKDKTESLVQTAHTNAVFDFIKEAENIHLNAETDQYHCSKKEIEDIVTSACKAPSGGNSQPWRWVYKSDCLLLFNPFEPNATLLDYNGYASFIAIGAAIENINMHAEALGLSVKTEFFPRGEENKLVAIIRFYKTGKTGIDSTEILRAINSRFTNRKLGKRPVISHQTLSQLTHVVQSVKGASLQFITNEKQLDKAGNLLGEIEKIRLLEKMGHSDFVKEMRWTEAENNSMRDGVDIRTVDLTNSELAGFKIAKNADVIALLNEWNGGGALQKITKKAVDASGALGILSLKGNGKTDYITAGRALEKVWIEANMAGLSFHPVSACLFMYARVLKGKGNGLSKKAYTQLKKLRPDFESTFQLQKNLQEMFIFRLAKCGPPEIKSLRRPLNDLFCYF